jgi:hypothetical protein
MLLHLSRKALTNLALLFNHILLFGHFPTAWKSAKVIPIPKPGKPPSDPCSHRPISLLSTLSKLLELFISPQTEPFYPSEPHSAPRTVWLPEEKHSSAHQLARITDFITRGFNLNKHTGMVLLDIEKAYDTVWLTGFLYKLTLLLFPPYLLFFLQSYLEDRTFTVHLNGTNLMPKQTPSGLPHGAVLSNILFALYLSDIPHPPHTHLALHADDTALLSQSWRPDTISHRLSQAVATLLKYFTKWKLRLNAHTTESIRFSKRRPCLPDPVKLDNVRWASDVKYLGLLLDPTLFYTKHLHTVRTKPQVLFVTSSLSLIEIPHSHKPPN